MKETKQKIKLTEMQFKQIKGNLDNTEYKI